MSLTVTFDPSGDVSAATERVTPAHKLRCTEVRRDAGGGAVNVARVLMPARAVQPAGDAGSFGVCDIRRVLQSRFESAC